MKEKKYFVLLLIILSILVITGFTLPAQEPVGYYPFDKDTSDYSENMNQGINHGAKHVEECVIGGCYQFQGLSDYIQLQHYPITEPPFTISVWAKKTGNSTSGSDSWNSLIRTNSPAKKRASYALYWSDLINRIQFRISGAESRGATYMNPPINEWVHITAIFADNQTKLFINGELKDVEPANKALGVPEWPFSIGGQGGGSDDNYFHGLIDELIIYDKALTESEIKDYYEITKPTKEKESVIKKIFPKEDFKFILIIAILLIMIILQQIEIKVLKKKSRKKRNK